MKKKCVIITLLAMLLFAALVSCSDSSDKLSSGEGDYVFDGIEFIEGNNSECYEVLRSWSHPEKEPIKITRRLITLTLEETQKDPNNNTFMVKHGDTVLGCSGEDLRDIVGDNTDAAKDIQDGDVILLPAGTIHVNGNSGDPLSFHNTTLVGSSAEGGTKIIAHGGDTCSRCFRLYHRQADSVKAGNTRYANLYNLKIDGSNVSGTTLFYTTAYYGVISMKDVSLEGYTTLFSIWGAEALTDSTYPTKDDNAGVDIYLRNVDTDSNATKLIAFQSSPWDSIPSAFSYAAISYDNNCSTNGSTFISSYDWDSRSIHGQENAFINGQLIKEAKPAK